MRTARRTALSLFLALMFQIVASAQFQKEAFSQNYGADEGATADSTEQLFSIKEYIGGLAHKNEVKIGALTAGSAVVLGGSQIYNKDYWKLPVVYSGILGLGGYGAYRYSQYSSSNKAHEDFILARDAFLKENPDGVFSTPEPVIDRASKSVATKFFIGAAAFYWGALMDGVVCYDKGVNPHPGRATLYSVLCPGLGQAYNGEYWKMPIYYGCLLGAYHFYHTNSLNYKRFKRIHNEATNPDKSYSGPISGETAKYYRDIYRRYRDYSTVALIGFYLLQVIDANIFAYMYDFEVSDDIVSMELQPAVIPTGNNYAMKGGGPNAYGFGLSLRF